MLAAALSSCNLITFSGSAFDVEQDCESCNDTVLVYDVEEFTEIVCDVPCYIEYSNDSVAGCELTLPVELSSAIEVVCVGGKLEIGSADTRKFRNSNIRIRLCSSSVERIGIRGAAEIDFVDAVVSDTLIVDASGAVELNADKLKAAMVSMAVSGAGDIDISELECGFFCANVSGAANIVIAGKAEQADITVSGAGDIDVRHLDCDNVKTNTYGVGKVRRK